MDPHIWPSKAGRPARTYIQQLCEDTRCSPEDLPEAMNDREKWRERVRDVRTAGTTWWWWSIHRSFLFQEWKSPHHNSFWYYTTKMKELKVHIRHTSLWVFKNNKIATETAEKICSVYDQGVINDCQVRNIFSFRWFVIKRRTQTKTLIRPWSRYFKTIGAIGYEN